MALLAELRFYGHELEDRYFIDIDHCFRNINLRMNRNDQKRNARRGR